MAFLQQNVLIYTTCYNVLDGVTLTIRKLEQEILAAGHNLCILTTLSGDSNNTHLDGEHPNRRVMFMDNAKPVPFVHDPNNPELSYQIGFNLSRSMKHKLDDFEPTLIHITVPDCTALHLVEYARRKEIPIMGTYHSNIPEYMDHYPGMGWLKPILGSFFRHQYNFLQALYVPTPFIRRHLTDTYQLDRATKLGIWGRGVDIDRFHPSHRYAAGGKFRAQLGLTDDDVVLCWVGRLVPEKRVDIFCDTVRRMHAQGLRFHAIVVGAGPSEEEVKSLPNTTFCGWMNSTQLAVAYASSDVFLFPSSVETFGNVTLEAMASGLPVVVESGCSGHLVEQGVNGFACPAGDADAFFEATAELVRDHSKRAMCGQNSRVKAEQLEKGMVVRRMLQNYQSVTEEFYTEYGGHHSNRDKAYKFLAGNHPRPLVLVMVEWLFIVLFQVLWNMSQLFFWAQEGLLKRRGGPSSISETIPIQQELTKVPVSPSRSTDFTVSSASLASDDMSSDALANDSDEECEVDEDSEEEPTSRRCEMKTDIPTALSTSFIHTMEFSCRWESRVRNSMTSCGKSTLRGVLRKRKNSFDENDTEATRSKTNSMDATTSTLSRNSSSHGSGSAGIVTNKKTVRRTGASLSAQGMMDVVTCAMKPQQTSSPVHASLQVV
eukprot:CAMPEP_0172450406 /NCGR_PEP_ID=MMETSP1065-20121228/8754_1 /TAXON_ID=265537 /ORGANISM="Amphiprora paludosa, Strain CCMP125" /LENGTH=657 /DNA_ID=CAMNT_0013202187 /DNA_START=206 /DNA_END=2179 /DNA_ORIENTATION=+